MDKKFSKKPSFFYGWIIVAVAALGVFFSGPGQTYSVSVFIDSFIKDFGWSRSFVSSLYSGGTLLAGFFLFFIGRSIDKFGHRIMMPLVALLFGLSCIGLSFVFHPFMLFMGFMLIRLLGQGSMTLLSSTLVPQWFFRRRGLALSFLTVGAGVSSTLLPPFNTWIIQTFNWQSGWLFWGVMLVLVMTPCALIFVRNRPEDLGLRPDNRAVKNDVEVVDNPLEINSWNFQEARKTLSFWLILFAMFVASLVNTGITFHLISLLAPRGVSAMGAASVLSIMAFVALPVAFLAGWILDRWQNPRIFLFLTFLGHLIFIFMIYQTGSVWAAWIAGVIWGAVVGSQSMSFNYIWPHYYGREYLGSIRGFAMVSTVLGSAFGPLPFGLAFDYWGGYGEILLITAILPFLAVLACFLAVPPDRKTLQNG